MIIIATVPIAKMNQRRLRDQINWFSVVEHSFVKTVPQKYICQGLVTGYGIVLMDPMKRCGVFNFGSVFEML